MRRRVGAFDVSRLDFHRALLVLGAEVLQAGTCIRRLKYPGLVIGLLGAWDHAGRSLLSRRLSATPQPKE